MYLVKNWPTLLEKLKNLIDELGLKRVGGRFELDEWGTYHFFLEKLVAKTTQKTTHILSTITLFGKLVGLLLLEAWPSGRWRWS